MRLEPVFLVAPRPQPPSMPTRRAILLASGTFLGGAVLAFAAQSLTGHRSRTDPPAADDATAVWLRRVCHDGTPIEQLIACRGALLYHIRAGTADDRLLHGLKRLAVFAIDSPKTPQRQQIARELVEYRDHTETDASQWHWDTLRSVAGG